MKYKISFKRNDNQKWWGGGSVDLSGEKPRISVKKTPELMAMINAAGEGSYIPLYLFPDEGKREARKPVELDDEIDDSKFGSVPF